MYELVSFVKSVKTLGKRHVLNVTAVKRNCLTVRQAVTQVLARFCGAGR
ncbi:MAG: hypothetical protein RLZZ352_1196 [Pseudomonadota bacterium]|jgi:hypothetical protein